ncbi:MAG: glycine cleavage system aminomethyltransferase GcvT [Candidatus Hodarchaeaceae archaeon]|nr:glycine cleavage system aminomethyltransferase GcvT [Candidatus Hodarchaeaceae archaeon]
MKQLQLARVHRSLGAEMVPFAGWEMPLRYSGIVEEHLAVREAVGLFDVSHMGEILVRKKDAGSFLQRTTTNDISRLNVFDAHYSTVLNERGGIMDDVFIYRVEEHAYMVVTNAINIEKIYGWFKQQESGDVEIQNITDTTLMLALQGPRAEQVLQQLTEFELDQLGRFRATSIEVAGLPTLVSRTGYTGEDGFELYLTGEPASNPARAEGLWNALLSAGRGVGIKPCGLGARDTTRLEAGFVLYDHELNEETTPFEAKISYAVKLEKGEFIGREALMRQRATGLRRVRIGMRMLDRGVPRQGYRVLEDGEEVGYVTSGTISPLLNVGIAMGYASPDIAPGARVAIEIHGKPRAAEVVNWPFYDTEKYGFTRRMT